jgi:putative colanic acid biosynthesis acetyltransferase WcaF
MFYKQKYHSELSLGNKISRSVWSCVWILVGRFSPRVLFFWRNVCLGIFRARLGAGVRIYPGVKVFAPWNLEMGDRSSFGEDVDCYCVDHIRIGPDVIVSQYAQLCTASHDINSPTRKLVTAPIHLEEGCLVFMGAFIGPGVTVGRGAVVAAHAVVTKDVSPFTVVAGNPAREIKKRVMREEG